MGGRGAEECSIVGGGVRFGGLGSVLGSGAFRELFRRLQIIAGRDSCWFGENAVLGSVLDKFLLYRVSGVMLFPLQPSFCNKGSL
jgi:hypothetical protein